MTRPRKYRVSSTFFNGYSLKMTRMWWAPCSIPTLVRALSRREPDHLFSLYELERKGRERVWHYRGGKRVAGE